jgi:hypothetical protein
MALSSAPSLLALFHARSAHGFVLFRAFFPATQLCIVSDADALLSFKQSAKNYAVL